MRRGDRAAEKAYRQDLAKLYVMFGEDFKMRDEPNTTEAAIYLKKALKLVPQHPVANYRYAHLLYQDRKYAEAVVHFNLALDSGMEPVITESQTLIAHIFLVNCGVLIAKDSFREVEHLQGYKHDELDKTLTGRYLDQMLLESDEMLQRYLYRRTTDEGTASISESQYFDFCKRMQANEIIIRADLHRREILFDSHPPVRLDLLSFYVMNRLLRSRAWLQGKDLIESLKASSQEIEISPESMRQIFSRLQRRIPFWDEMIETVATGNKTERRRQAGTAYTLLCHASVLTP